MKKNLIAISLATVLGCSVPLTGAYAQPAFPDASAGAPPMQGRYPGAQRPDPAMRQQYMQNRLDWLHSQLSLRADQELAWQRLNDYLTAQAAAKANWQQPFVNELPATAVGRIDVMLQRSAERQEFLGGLKTEVEAFYGVLDTTQKTLFDQNFHMGPRNNNGTPGPQGFRYGTHHRSKCFGPGW